MKEQRKTLSTRRKLKAQKSGSKSSLSVFAGYADLLAEVKSRIYAAQNRAMLSANSEMIALYWDVGRMIDERQKREKWGAAVIPRLARDIRNEFSEVKGFSERNIGRMIAFYRTYPNLSIILPQAVAKLPLAEKSLKAQSKTSETLPQPVAKSEITRATLVLQQLVGQLPWGHHILLIEKVKDLSTRLWYMQMALTHGWSRNILNLQIQSRAHERKGQAITNFQMNLPAPQSELARQALKDPYIFDFLTLEEPFHDWEVKRLKLMLSEPLKYGANESAEMDDPQLPRYIRITDIDDNGLLRNETFRSLPWEVATPFLLQDGDLLFARSGATSGKSFLYKKDWETVHTLAT